MIYRATPIKDEDKEILFEMENPFSGKIHYVSILKSEIFRPDRLYKEGYTANYNDENGELRVTLPKTTKEVKGV